MNEDFIRPPEIHYSEPFIEYHYDRSPFVLRRHCLRVVEECFKDGVSVGNIARQDLQFIMNVEEFCYNQGWYVRYVPVLSEIFGSLYYDVEGSQFRFYKHKHALLTKLAIQL